MHLIRLVYASKASPSFLLSDMEDILRVSSENNQESGITGVLCYNNSNFLQCLEGSRLAVNQLYHRILTDYRHEEPAILLYEEITERDFTDWSMAYVPAASISGEIVQQFSGSKVFSPFSMSGESCYLLLKALACMGVTRKD